MIQAALRRPPRAPSAAPPGRSISPTPPPGRLAPTAGQRPFRRGRNVGSDQHDGIDFRSLKPGDQSLGWARRWERAQSRLPALLTPHTEDLSGEAVKDARDDLFAFFMQTYHIKDALKVEATSLGIDKKEVESAVNADPDLRLLGGLANLAKHHGKGRDADAPEIIRTRGTSGDTGGGWRLDVTIRRSGEDLDGLQIAQSAVDAWRGLLSGWGLI